MLRVRRRCWTARTERSLQLDLRRPGRRLRSWLSRACVDVGSARKSPQIWTTCVRVLRVGLATSSDGTGVTGVSRVTMRNRERIATLLAVRRLGSARFGPTRADRGIRAAGQADPARGRIPLLPMTAPHSRVAPLQPAEPLRPRRRRFRILRPDDRRARGDAARQARPRGRPATPHRRQRLLRGRAADRHRGPQVRCAPVPHVQQAGVGLRAAVHRLHRLPAPGVRACTTARPTSSRWAWAWCRSSSAGTSRRTRRAR